MQSPAPTALLLIGIPATGKSSFCRHYLFESHVRINRDQLKTRYREHLLLDACLCGRQPFVVDNTNVSRSVRAPFITLAKRNGFRVIGYYFSSKLDEALERNRLRHGDARIPDKGVAGMAGRLQLPDLSEGFDELWYVRMDGSGGFICEEWCAQEDVTKFSQSGEETATLHLYTEVTTE